MALNHKVEFKSEQTIALVAAHCWNISHQRRAYTFDVVGFIKDILAAKGIDTVVPSRGRSKGKLALEFFDREFIQDDPAWVEFDKDKREHYVTLHVDREVWRLAESGDSDACEVLAHEIGHILLHDHHANAFSSDSSNQRLFEGSSNEDFAEWQAITFAGHLIVPPHAVRKFSDLALLAIATNAPERLARQRLDQSEKRPLKRIYEGDACGTCFNFTLVRNGCTTKCDTCGRVERA
jgi:hypothetical protein